MILDWQKHCIKVHKTKKFSTKDPSDNKSLFSQEAHYLKFLEMQGYDYKTSYYYWTQIKNGIAALFKDEPEQLTSSFSRIFRASTNISKESMVRQYEPIKIYKSEIKFINAQNAPVWVKKYWCCMLIYWKMAHQHAEYVPITSTLCNWAMRKTHLKDSFYGHHQDQIAQFNHISDKPVITTDVIGKKNTRYYCFEWLDSCTHKKFIELDDIEQCSKILKYIKGDKKKCPECKKTFYAKPKQQTDLCPRCYKAHRKQVIRENSNNYYMEKRKKAQMVHACE